MYVDVSFILHSVLSNIQTGKERAAVACLYLQQGLPYNQVIYISNDVVVASMVMIPFISLIHWKLSILKSGVHFLPEILLSGVGPSFCQIHNTYLLYILRLCVRVFAPMSSFIHFCWDEEFVVNQCNTRILHKTLPQLDVLLTC